MVRKVILISITLIFALGILVVSIFRTSFNKQAVASFQAKTIESTPSGEDQLASPSTKAEPEKLVSYDLVWPGILPDHFLYPLKMVRDRILIILTTGTDKKAELFLKLADKRIWSAQLLVDKGKNDLGVSTATKAEKYLQQAVEQAKLAQKEGKEITSFWEKLILASQKHQEILLQIKGKIGDQSKSVVEETLRSVENSLNEAKSALKK